MTAAATCEKSIQCLRKRTFLQNNFGTFQVPFSHSLPQRKVASRVPLVDIGTSQQVEFEHLRRVQVSSEIDGGGDVEILVSFALKQFVAVSNE